MIKSLLLENFRCFGGSNEVALRPLTLLVGENSSGKTSFLAAARLVDSLRQRVSDLDFNQEPFNLGSYEEIATNKSPKIGAARQFKLGCTFARKREATITFVGTFRESNGRPELKKFEVWSGQYQVVSDDCLHVRTPSEEQKTFRFASPSDASAHRLRGPTNFERQLIMAFQSMHFGDEDAKALQELVWTWYPEEDVVLAYACAPIRSQFKRTFDWLSDLPRPEGDHIPMMLAQMHGKEVWEELRKPLHDFGRASGLYDEVLVRKLGRGEGSPFQVCVKLAGAIRNLVDVGYGVSQALPLVVDLLRHKRSRLYLVQQPEVHLHPRAQAELGTLLATIVRAQKQKQLLIETHSDYIIDRVRMEVRNKTLKPADVMILYFERRKSEVSIHPINLDDEGNLIDPPPSYRSFSLEEESRFLGLEDVHHS